MTDTLVAIMKQPGNWKKDEAAVDKSLKFLTTLAKPDGSIFSKDMPAVNTAIAIMALAMPHLSARLSASKKRNDGKRDSK